MEIQQSLSGGPSPSSLSAQSPSFTAYSSENLADIAARVVSELNLHHHHDPYDDDFYSSLPNDAVHHKGDAENDDDDVSEFEFTVLCGGDNSSPISADEIFCNGQIRPVYPLFNSDLLYQNDAVDDPPENPPTPTTIRLPLRRLMMEERENGAPSCSSSEADDLEGLPPGTYCVWAPKKKNNNNSQNDDVLMRKKSNSTGSNSKRWRIRDLLYRSNSDGEDTFVFLTPSQHHHHHGGGNGGDSKRREKAPAMIAGAKKKKSYLPYRQDLIGFFATVNGISRTVRPF